MRRLLIALTALAIAPSLSAQDGIILTRQAKNPGGHLLTNKQIFVQRDVYPDEGYGQWTGDRTFRYLRDKWQFATVTADGSIAPAVPEIPQISAIPAGAENKTPCGEYTLYTEGHSLLASDGKRILNVAVSDDDNITYGQTVSRNEMGIDGGIFPAPDGSKVAFYRKDESRVTDFPLLDITTRTGSLKSIKYPMNGMDSELITLGVYEFATGRTVYMNVTDFTEERYLTNIAWSPDASTIYIQVVDRPQHQMHLNAYNAASGEFKRTLLTEENDAWIEPLDPVFFLEGRDDLMIYRTDNRDGYRNLYLVDTLGDIRRLTAVNADVAYLDNDGKSVFYSSAEVSPIENHAFRIDITAGIAKKEKDLPAIVKKAKFSKPVRLTLERGWHDVSLSGDKTLLLDNYSSLEVPLTTWLRDRNGKILQTVAESRNPLAPFAQCEVSIGKLPTADGQYDNYYRIIKPLNFDPSKKYPVILYVYGGPHSQLVQDTWLAGAGLWEMLMAEKGYVVYVQDNRGTQNRGAAYEKEINRRCGVKEMADQIEGINLLCNEPWVDQDRIGVHGWSYGGFMTISLMTHYPDVFKVAVAGGPVIDWKWYEIMYGERYMDTPETNPEGFEETSLMNQPLALKGKLLICQGMIDNTVVPEHSLSFVEACIRHFVQLDYFPYPTTEHNVRVPWRAHLMDKVTMFFDDNL